MILQVPFPEFAITVHRLLKSKEAYVSARGSTTLATAATAGTTVVSLATTSMGEARAVLESAGLEVYEGSWHTGAALDLEMNLSTPYVAAVSYVSQERTPGLWVDAYATLPTHIQVLRAMYDEFHETGQMGDVGFEEFTRLAKPNVVILSPEQLHGFVSGKDCR
jgi:hypothetical protein